MDFVNSQIKRLAAKYAPFGITEQKIREMTQYAADGDNIPFKRALFGARSVLSEVFNQPDEISYEEAVDEILSETPNNSVLADNQYLQ